MQVKIEVTPVLRGCVYEPESRSVSAGVEKRFGFAAMQVVSFADLYAGTLAVGSDPDAHAQSAKGEVLHLGLHGEREPLGDEKGRDVAYGDHRLSADD